MARADFFTDATQTANNRDALVCHSTDLESHIHLTQRFLTSVVDWKR